MLQIDQLGYLAFERTHERSLRLQSIIQMQWNSFDIATFISFWRLHNDSVFCRRSWPNGFGPSSEKLGNSAGPRRCCRAHFTVPHWWVELAWLKWSKARLNTEAIFRSQKMRIDERLYCGSISKSWICQSACVCMCVYVCLHDTDKRTLKLYIRHMLNTETAYDFENCPNTRPVHTKLLYTDFFHVGNRFQIV